MAHGFKFLGHIGFHDAPLHDGGIVFHDADGDQYEFVLTAKHGPTRELRQVYLFHMNLAAEAVWESIAYDSYAFTTLGIEQDAWRAAIYDRDNPLRAARAAFAYASTLDAGDLWKFDLVRWNFGRDQATRALDVVNRWNLLRST